MHKSGTYYIQMLYGTIVKKKKNQYNIPNYIINLIYFKLIRSILFIKYIHMICISSYYKILSIII